MLINFLKQSWLVMVAALVFGLLVAGVNGALEDRIAQNAKDKLNRMMQQLLSDAEVFEEVMVDAESDKVLYWQAKDAAGEVVGYAIKATGGGFADKIGLLVAFDPELTTLRGIAVLFSNETPGFGDKIKHASTATKISFKDQFKGSPLTAKLELIKTGDRAKADSEIVAITGATISSDAVLEIVNGAVDAMRDIIAH